MYKLSEFIYSINLMRTIFYMLVSSVFTDHKRIESKEKMHKCTKFKKFHL